MNNQPEPGISGRPADASQKGWRNLLLPSHSRGNVLARRLFVATSTIATISFLLSGVTSVVGNDSIQWGFTILFWLAAFVAIPALIATVATGSRTRGRAVKNELESHTSIQRRRRSMTTVGDERRLSWSSLAIKTVIVHTTTYFVAGILAYTLGGYEKSFSQPPLSYFMRPASDPLVMAGPLFQPIRGVIFASAFYPLRDVLFGQRRGWLILWWLLLALGVLSTFGPAPGSVEGLIYTIISPVSQILGLWEVLLQSLLFSFIIFYWVNHSEKRWLGWTLSIAFSIVVILNLLGLLTNGATGGAKHSG